ncbi:acyl-CoA synthetase [Pontivivens insulae]|uniref:Long-chain-fatty-acid--CoA ligase n=1 Tax=Pontivivens insulae TaxID=1639689 RepID=A0A2R8A757_9RHOB|nr:acyl-CoA synthetase [Pontivivens insulae]RED18180.1 fatty-acyl-CoA synthase [Pontivivens insulae]SPF28077.1 Long-chain-fatty-acid--CoA ligase [Pontivivens insulae]
MSHIYQHAERTPDKIAIEMVGSGATRTYRQLDDASNRGAQALRALGIEQGDHIAVLLENRPELLEIYFACQRAGVYFTAISRYLGADEAGYIVSDCGAKIFIASDQTIEAARPIAADQSLRCFTVDIAQDDFESWQALCDPLPTTRIRDEAKGHYMLYSSGTTGRPKGIKRVFDGGPIEGIHPMMQVVCLQMGGMDENSTYLSPAPLYHSAPLAVASSALMYGARVVIMEKFAPDAFLSALEDYEITHTQVVPTMFVRLLKLPDATRTRNDVSKLTCAIHVAAPCPIEVKKAMIEWWGPILIEYYGGTEGNGVTICDTVDWLAHPGTVGKPLLGRVVIVDETGSPLPNGQTGDVYFDAGLKFSYHNDPEKTAAAHHPEGWSTLGDVGYLDADGFLHLTDRRAFTIITGGVNVYPQETEDRLIMHPLVRDAAVFGIPDPDLGEAVHAVVELLAPADAPADIDSQLAQWCRAALSGIKCPRSIEFTPALPRTETGKLMKRVLRDAYYR